MGYIIAGLQFPQRAQGDRLAFIISLFDFILMVALKDLVIRITNNFQILINKSFMDGSGNGFELNTRFQIFKNGMQPLQLFWIFRKKKNPELVIFDLN